MYPNELAQMQGSVGWSRPAAGKPFISPNGTVEGAAPKGSVYVEFDVPGNSLLMGGRKGRFNDWDRCQ